MLRVREVPARVFIRDGEDLAAASGKTRIAKRSPAGRLLALVALGVALGSGGMVLTASMVLAENDDARESNLQEIARRTEEARIRNATYTSTRPAPQAHAYAPAGNGWRLPFMQMLPDGRLAQPQIELNPFRKPTRKSAAHQHRIPGTTTATLDAATGAADRAQTFCVRLCDGFHAPIGYVRSSGDLKAHEAICKAMNPGIPVKVFRAAAGTAGIADAIAADGKRYSALPMAFSHEKSADPACRPAIVQAGERRVSLLRDITLRPGDSVVLDGKVSTFTGGSSWPYSRRDFRDFRTAAELSKTQRKQIDEQVGISRMEAQARTVRRQMRVREAQLQDDTVASDAILRGTVDPTMREPVRLIPLSLPVR